MFNVLLVDDEEMSLVALQYLVPWKDYGFTEIHATTSSAEALKMLKEQRIDACFLDINMPELSGLELLEAARQEGIETRFIIVSGYSEFSYAKQAIAYGVLDYCLKPVVVEDFLPVLDKLAKNVFKTRITQDSVLFSQILSGDSACEKFVSELAEKDTGCTELTFMLLRADELLQVLQQMDNAGYAKGYILNGNEALLVWTSEAEAEQAMDSFGNNKQQMFLLYGVGECNVPSVQRICKRMFKVFRARDGVSGEMMKISDVNEKTAVLLQDVLSHIDGNYEKDITLQDIAQTFGINYSYLSQLFKKVLGLSYAEYLNKTRLTKACQLLSDTYMQITEVAEAVGIPDYHYFCKVFKKYYAMTPSQYRAVNKEGQIV